MILTHDLGTTGDKAAMFGDDGALKAATTARYPTVFGSGGRAEQSPLDWWDAVIRSTRELLEQTGTDPAKITCVSFSGQMMGAVFLDGTGEPVRPAIIWADTRSAGQCEPLLGRIPMARVYELTGHRLNATYSLTKVLWVREHEPAAYAATRVIVQAKDFVAYRLTGHLATDPSDASSTNAFDQKAGAWSEEILAAADVPMALWPEVVPSTTVIGHVTSEAAALTGLAQGTPVVIGGGDGPCAAAGAGVVAPGSAYTYLGSSSWISLAADEPLLDPRMRTMTFNHVVPGRFVPTATMQAGGGSLEWISELLAEPHADLLQAAIKVEAAGDGLFFLPHLLGERSPYWNPKARAAFIGLARHHERAHLFRAVLEGVAMNLLTGLRAFAGNGTAIERIDAVGGAAVAGEVLHVLADVWGLPVRRRTIVEANSLGAAIVGGIAMGVFDGFGIAPALSAAEPPIMPDKIAHERYIPQYHRFLDAYARLEPWFNEH
ncbi:xylulokinase [Nonomuraea longispora]|uniref:Xylulokinase n=1 Tax=Nonomuraea longispora TaxID=1848320 RepID=A0A4R4NIL2_9ACTN|nr:FGGY family carbohydrate kinase [Nonomuraea longispora]TDC07277.1 xylulokinase [Nonomuraea longispora]